MKAIPIKKARSEAAVTLFKELLEQAEAGVITNVAMVYTRADASFATRATPIDNIPETIGKLMILISDLVASTTKEG